VMLVLPAGRPVVMPGGDARWRAGSSGTTFVRIGSSERSTGGKAMSKGNTGAAAGGGALYGLGIFGALFYYWQQADSFWEYVWAIFPKAIFWPAYIVYEGFRALGA
jgi:hypothetical protein